MADLQESVTRCERSVLDATAVAATVQRQEPDPVPGTARWRGGGVLVAASSMAGAVSVKEPLQQGVLTFGAGRRRGGGVLEAASSNVVCGTSQCLQVRLDDEGGRSDTSEVWDADWNNVPDAEAADSATAGVG